MEKKSEKKSKIIIDGEAMEAVSVSKPVFEDGAWEIIGDAPLVLHNFSQKAQLEMTAKQTDPTRKNVKTYKPRDAEELFMSARYIDVKEGWDGFQASSIRAACIRAGTLVGIKMVMAKMTIFCKADGYDERGNGLVRITEGNPIPDERPVPLKNTWDIRTRPMWMPGWKATVNLRWDPRQFKKQDVENLLIRVGVQVGIGEGRPSSPKSCGMGWGTFNVERR